MTGKGRFFSKGEGKMFQFVKSTCMWTKNCSWTLISGTCCYKILVLFRNYFVQNSAFLNYNLCVFFINIVLAGASVCHQLSENMWLDRLTLVLRWLIRLWIWIFGTGGRIDGQHWRCSKMSSPNGPKIIVQSSIE